MATLSSKSASSVCYFFGSHALHITKLLQVYKHDLSNCKRRITANSVSPFYSVDAFNQVRKQILELAAQHCKGSLGRLPESLLSDIPAELPDFSSDSLASIQLRAVYVQHAVWRILHQRIFQPFLFTLTRRQADADKLFKEIAENFRHDSWRRETWWRQQTLNAAYTASTAKQSINKVAAVVLEEIMEHIQYLTRVEEREQIKVAIRRIIKLSAETWRYVR